MSTSPLPLRFTAPRPPIKESDAKKAADLESMAQLIEDLIPKFKKDEEKQFYREVVESYRAAAQNLRSATRPRLRQPGIGGQAGSILMIVVGDDQTRRFQRQHCFLADTTVLFSNLLVTQHNT
jgi:hypothetical protein